MAACMITGGKLGDMFGRRRVFAGGLMVYGLGSAITAVAPTLAVPAMGWSARSTPAEVDAVVNSYAEAQLNSLKAAILAAAGITVVCFAFTRHLPTEPPTTAPHPAAGEPPSGERG